MQAALEKGTEGFDPLQDLFTAQSAKPAHLAGINLRVLNPFHRALLVIDGTVTKFIEAYTMEPVEVLRLSQGTRRLPSDHLWLDAPQGTTVIAREVLLRGDYSHTIYAYALSLILPERMGDFEKSNLEADGGSLGRILLESRLETYREILWYGKENINPLPLAIQNLTGSEFISRTYRIFANGKPIMLINEKFPTENEGLPSHH